MKHSTIVNILNIVAIFNLVFGVIAAFTLTPSFGAQIAILIGFATVGSSILFVSFGAVIELLNNITSAAETKKPHVSLYRPITEDHMYSR